LSDSQHRRPREWWFTQLTLFLWAWMLLAARAVRSSAMDQGVYQIGDV
jgi:hypothetical protein